MPDSDIVVSGLAITPGFGQTFAEWAVDDPHWNGVEQLRLDRVEVHAATSNNRDLASKVAEGITECIHRVSDGLARWYWIRARNRAGVFGDWQPSSPTGGVAASATASIGVNGYVKFPSGLIIQWGFDTNDNYRTITFPIAFPTQVFAVIAVANSPGVGGMTQYACVDQEPTLTQFNVTGGRIEAPSSVTAEVFDDIAWVAFGR